jgi:hypothetical protein
MYFIFMKQTQKQLKQIEFWFVLVSNEFFFPVRKQPNSYIVYLFYLST